PQQPDEVRNARPDMGFGARSIVELGLVSSPPHAPVPVSISMNGSTAARGLGQVTGHSVRTVRDYASM
ncbi:hypothetical protein E4U32_004718, partial [Claviceps aff. humidiphila group G2b]